jgi:enterochelin esterase family protein
MLPLFSMRIFPAIFVLSMVQAVWGQEKLLPNKPIARNLEAGRTEVFPLLLNDGDYVSGSVKQQAKVDVTVLNPDGSVHRLFPGPSGDGKIQFAFAAEGGGSYSIKIANPGAQGARYELLVEKILPLDTRLQPEIWTDPFPSPRIQALRNQLASGQSTTEAFWKEIATQGTPLVEPFGSDGKYQLVTFLWRAQNETRNVLVLGSFDDPVLLKSLSMHRIGTSDVWYLTVKLPAGARFTYILSPNDPMTNDGPRADQGGATRQMDPLNPRHANCPSGATKFACISVAELPQASPQPWIARRGAPAGRIEKGTLKSAMQNLERGFSVYLPHNYSPAGRPNALLILFDGPDYLSSEAEDGTLRETPTILDNLIAASRIPPTVVVFVENVSGRRLMDLVGNSKFADSIATELVPYIRSHYNVTKQPAQTVVGGYSAGGLASVYVGLRHSEVFGNVFSQSGPFWWAPEHNGGHCGPDCLAAGYAPNRSTDATTEGNWMVREYLASEKLPLRFYLEAGTFEIDKKGEGGDVLEPTRHLRDVLRAKGYQVHYRQFVGGHDGLSWRGGIADALIALLGETAQEKGN